MELLLKIKDSKAAAFLQVINDLPYVETEILLPKSKAKIKQGIVAAMKEVELHRKGKIKLQEAKDFIREMKRV